MSDNTMVRSVVVVFITLVFFCETCEATGDKNITNINARWLISVDAPWNSCDVTIATQSLKPGVDFNHSSVIKVGDCDQGRFQYYITQHNKGMMTVTATFWTSLIQAMPPSCTFQWGGGYQNPTAKDMDKSPLPGCYVQDSQEGYHPTNYLFHLLMWQWY